MNSIESVYVMYLMFVCVLYLVQFLKLYLRNDVHNFTNPGGVWILDSVIYFIAPVYL